MPVWLSQMRRPRLTPTVVINPADDSEFASHVRAVLPTAGWSPDGLQRMLSRHYPRVAVHRRELSSEPIEVWYVYRDGHWTPPTDARRSDRSE